MVTLHALNKLNQVRDKEMSWRFHLTVSRNEGEKGEKIPKNGEKYDGGEKGHFWNVGPIPFKSWSKGGKVIRVIDQVFHRVHFGGNPVVRCIHH